MPQARMIPTASTRGPPYILSRRRVEGYDWSSEIQHDEIPFFSRRQRCALWDGRRQEIDRSDAAPEIYRPQGLDGGRRPRGGGAAKKSRARRFHAGSNHF